MDSNAILVVDDSSSIRALTCAVLEEAGYAVLEAVDGQDGLSKLAQHRVDMVVSDFNMPHLNGIEMIAQIRQRDSPARLPAIIISTENSPAIRRQANEAGVDDWLLKPVDPGLLLMTVARLLQPRPVQAAQTPEAMSAATSCTEIALSGALTVTEMDERQDEILALLNYPRLRLNLAQLRELDACGAQLLVILWQEARNRQIELSFCAADQSVRQCLAWVGLSCADSNAEIGHESR